MLQPMHYFSHAMPDIKRQLMILSEEERLPLEALVDEAKANPKFILPPNGRYEELDVFSGVVPDSLYLPYKVMAIEFSSPEFKDERPDKTKSSRRIAIVFNVYQDEVDDDLLISNLPLVGVVGLSWIDKLSMWIFSHAYGFLTTTSPEASTEHLQPMETPDGRTLMTIGGKHVRYGVGTMLPSITAAIAEKAGVSEEVVLRAGGEDLLEEAEATLSLITMLSFSNVGTTDIAPPSAINKKRARKNKEPFYTYKLLTIRKHGNIKHAVGGGHSSPRLHWRRGHVRKLHSGKATFVRAHMVGDANKGRIDKDYLIEG